MHAQPLAARCSRVLFSALAPLLAFAAIVNAGPLTPPAGPVASTAKPLSEIEPRIAISSTNTPGDGSTTYRITQPGSYYLTGNLQGEPNKNGIIVASANVTIDLNGFRMFGASNSIDGITNATSVNIVTVRNGTVAGWRIGINLQSDVTAGEGSEVHSVNINGNRGAGLLMGNRGRAVNVSAAGNASTGISIGEGAIVTGCVAALNGGTGISTGPGATVSGSVARQNNGNGFLLGAASSISGCTAAGNQGDGVGVGSGSCIHNCASRENGVAGFFINAGSSISNCSAQLNTSHGIEGSADNIIFANACDSNGNAGVGAGILITSEDNRVDNNNCTDNDFGIRVTGAGNLVIKNSCSGNTSNFDFNAGNRFGPIIDITASTAPVVSGNSAASTLLSSDPNANFAY